MTGTDYEQHFGRGVRALEAYEREVGPEQADVAQKAFTDALRAVPANVPEAERDHYRAVALGNLAGVRYARSTRTGAVHAMHQAMHQAIRYLNETLRLSDEEATAANLAAVLRLWQRLLPAHDFDELAEALDLMRELRERGGALHFDATIALLLTYEERLRRHEHEGDRLALARTAEETARIAVEQDRGDATAFLKTAAAHFLALADHPAEGYARKAPDLATEAVARCDPGSDQHQLYSLDWALTALMGLSKNENLPDAQVERMLPLLEQSVRRKAASDAGSSLPGLVTQLLVQWWEGSGRTDRRAAQAALAHAEAESATLTEDSPRLVPALHTIGILLQQRYAEVSGSSADLRQAAVCFRRITELSAPASSDHRDAAAHLMACRLSSPDDGPVLELVHPDDFDEPDPEAAPTEVLAVARGLLDSAVQQLARRGKL